MLLHSSEHGCIAAVVQTDLLQPCALDCGTPISSCQRGDPHTLVLTLNESENQQYPGKLKKLVEPFADFPGARRWYCVGEGRPGRRGLPKKYFNSAPRRMGSKCHTIGSQCGHTSGGGIPAQVWQPRLHPTAAAGAAARPASEITSNTVRRSVWDGCWGGC